MEIYGAGHSTIKIINMKKLIFHLPELIPNTKIGTFRYIGYIEVKSKIIRLNCSFKLPDGANAVVVGNLGTISSPVALVGGNCSIMALDKTGEEVMWTVKNKKKKDKHFCI